MLSSEGTRRPSCPPECPNRDRQESYLVNEINVEALASRGLWKAVALHTWAPLGLNTCSLLPHLRACVCFMNR